MKKLNLFFVLLFVILFANAQTYQITFTGSGASEIVDSVGIYNLTQNTSLTVDGADIVNLEVLDPSFIEFIANSSDNGIKVFPNPMNNSCQLEFLQNTEGLCKVFIVDIVGRIILSKNKYLKQGIHKFRISELPTGIYFIGVNTPEKNYSTKVISNLNTNKLGLVSYLSSTDLQESTVIPKNTKVVIEMQYFLGDLILFKGMSGDFATVIVSEITEDMIINFDFIPCTDADNNHYAIVKIEDQTWMYENLHTTTFAETESITFVTASTDWAEQTAGAYSWYDNDIENKDVFGALYNWYAVNGDSICPYGWKMPDTLDWQDLITHVGTQLTAGGELKQTGIDLWQNPNAGATNEFGFSALPGGERNLIEDFFNQGNTGAFWTSSQYDNENAIYLKMFHDNETIEQNYSPKTTGYSVRCILCDIAEIELNITEPTCDENGFASISNYDNELTYTFVPDGGIYADETGNILGFTFETLYKIVAENEQCQSDTVEFIVEEQLQGSVPTISLVENADICEDIESFFIDAFVDDYSELLWTTSGDGIFSNDTLMSPIYQFSPNDYAAGTVTLTVTAEPTNICGTSATESIVINLHPEPEIDMQTDDTECYGPLVSELGHYVWLNATATYYESTEWICTNCDGEIDYETEVIPIYLPTEMDYAVGYNDFIFKVHSLNPCNKVISEKVRVYYVKPDADAGPDQDIYGHTETYLTAKGATTGQSGWWSVVSDNGNVDNFEDYHDNLTKFTGEVGETYILTWTINDHDCWNVDSVEISFKTIYGDPCPGTPTFTDSRDGQTYNTVQIGNQCWMAENLNYNAAGSQCYDLDANNCNSYGRLYNWGTAMNGAESTTANPSEVQGVCPDGWHLPSFAEFYQLHDGLGWNDATYGVILKSELWDGTNESGFSALPGGYNYYDYNDPGENNFWNLGDKGYWWCSTEPEAFTDEAIHFMLQSSYVQFFEGHVTKFHKYSIRCVKNIDIPQVSTVLNDKVGYNSVRSGGVIHNEGASVVTTKGIVWSTSQEPTTDDNIGLVEDGSNESSYLSVMTDLLPETTYYARAFATNSQGTGYGQDISFTTTTDGIPVVEYHSVFDIHSSKAKSGGTISDEGGAAITQYGLIWSTNPNVDMENYQRIIALNESTSIFDTTMTELTPSTTYYVKAYAINSIGIAYANEVSFTTLEPGDGEHCMGINSLTDSRDGNEYEVVSIGTRCWMAENLKYLPEVHSYIYNNDNSPRYYVVGYHADETDVEAAKNLPYYQNYGVLYNHPAAMDACPDGWHLPTLGEWEDLIDYIDDDFLGGDQLKSCRTVNSTLGGDCNTTEHPRWNESLMPGFNEGTDDFGFSALPGGWILYEDDAWGYEITPGNEAIWWSLSFDTPEHYNQTFRLDANNVGYDFQMFRNNRGVSVRCVKD